LGWILGGGRLVVTIFLVESLVTSPMLLNTRFYIVFGLTDVEAVASIRFTIARNLAGTWREVC
jgi:hypothetical protein